MSVATTDTSRWLRIGFLGDGLFKVVLAVTYSAAVAPIANTLNMSVATIVIAAAMLLLSGIAEVVFALRSAAPSHTKYLIGYDSGWIVVTLVVLAMMTSGGAFWFGYQAVASAALAIAFMVGSARGSGDIGVRNTGWCRIFRYTNQHFGHELR
ncbi:hypothetical protein EV641_11123 [Rhodococcus sp. SMB37]|uniref:hypothetical protein n=1 Tax=Rhodococcus sp. SMB37 TaxID=2512213 RepID=UPI0006CF4F9E|nr:hypothetical protein [Rhodococcus sp. SMB37]TCN50747.1 hypothetical protein EV641_11123 [Rhodococcus sp. SMB37]